MTENVTTKTAESVTERSGFFMPAEWHPHDACWMAWPCRRSLWGENLAAACRAYAAVANAIAEYETVHMLVPEQWLQQARRLCTESVRIVPMPLDDSWLRDTGPLFTIDGKGGIRGTDWAFNGWGGKYRPHDRDAASSGAILQLLGIERVSVPMVLEGGAIDVDGSGRLLATEECLLNANRNPGWSRQRIERTLGTFLGIRQVVWLDRGLCGDETDGHVDNIARITPEGAVLLYFPQDAASPNRPAAEENRRRLLAAGLEVRPLPEPPIAMNETGYLLPRSYANFYIGNDAVFMPVFAACADDRARGIVGEMFPGRRIVCLPGKVLVTGGGNIHCITQQQPVP